MKINLEEIGKALGFPAAVIVLFGAVLSLFGLSIEQIVDIAGGLVGVSAAVGLVLDVLKWAGALPNGYAGKVSAAVNLGLLIVVAFVLKLYPAFDFGAADAQIGAFAQMAGVVFLYIVQLTASKQTHNLLVHGLGIRAFQHVNF